MGVTPQTVANGLKPYGLVYDLLSNYHVPVNWVINSSKSKDGTDFTYNGTAFSGGPFIITANFRTTAVNARITYWQGLGVIGVTTNAPITVPVYATFLAAPRWSLDHQNGSIAVNFFSSAGIPSSAYGGSSSSLWPYPSQLTCCDDIFVMPHADPTWATHQRLYSWNDECNGYVWLGCHAGSALTDMFDPANPANQTNFLTTKTLIPSGTGPYYQNSLVLWGNHSDGSIPYSYSYPSDPIMQFMGTIDAAQQNGSEQIYIPFAGQSWNPGALVYVSDPTPVNTLGTGIFSVGPAATLVSGRGFDNPGRGRVMMEAAHNISGTGTANVAAMRAFFNFSFLAGSEKALVPTITGLPTTLNSGQGYAISVTLPAGASPSDYTYSWTSSCGGTFSTSSTVQSVTYTPPVVSTQTTCSISVEIKDGCGRVTFDNHSVTVQCSLQVSSTVTNPCNGTPNGGAVNMTFTNATGPFIWNWTKSGGGAGSGSGTVISGLSAGTYTVTVTANNGTGCPATFTTTLTQSPSIVISATPGSVLCNGGSTGKISTLVTGGIPGYTYAWTETGVPGFSSTLANLSGLAAGTYNLTVTDSKGCTATLPVVVGTAAAISIVPTATNASCNGLNNGSISLQVNGGTPPYTYLWNDGNPSQNRTSLAPGTYSVTVTDANGCKASASGISISQPSAALTLSISSQQNLLCNGIASGAVTVAASGGTNPYSYSWTGPGTFTGSGPALTNLAAGSYNVTVTDGNHCTSTLTVTVTQPQALTLSTLVTRPTCPPGVNTLGNNGSISLSVTGGTAPYSYLWSASGTGIIPSGQSGNKDLTLLVAGNYNVQVKDANGCTATTSAVLTNINPNPVQPVQINH